MAFYRSMEESGAKSAASGEAVSNETSVGSKAEPNGAGCCGKAAGKKILVAANFGQDAVELPLEYEAGRVLLSNLPENHAGEKLTLAGCGVMVLECGKEA